MVFLELFLTFFSIGIVTFGGGYAMLMPIIQQVELHWSELFTGTQLKDFIAVAESTPGPFAINMSTYVGSVVGGAQGGFGMSVLGSFCATMGVVLPSFLVILIVVKLYDRFRASRLVKGAMTGLKPAVVGLIACAIWGVLLDVFVPGGKFSWAIFKTTDLYVSLGIFVTMVILAFKKVHPIILICLSAIAGIAFGYLGWLG